MSAKGCPLCFSRDVLAVIFCNVRGWSDNTGGQKVLDKYIRSSSTFTRVHVESSPPS